MPEDDPTVDAVRQRWMKTRDRVQGSPNYKDKWYAAQCGGCAYWVPLSDVLGSDFGTCANPDSHADGTVKFEHDGCDAWQEGPVWGGVEPWMKQE